MRIGLENLPSIICCNIGVWEPVKNGPVIVLAQSMLYDAACLKFTTSCFSGNSADSPAGSKRAAPERYRNHWFHEGPICESLEKLDFIMVMDRAYGKIERLDRDKADGQSFVILSLCCSNGCLMVHSTLFPVMQSFLLFALLA